MALGIIAGIISAIASLVTAVGSLIKSNKPDASASPAVHVAYAGLVESHEALSLHADKMADHVQTMSV